MTHLTLSSMISYKLLPLVVVLLLTPDCSPSLRFARVWQITPARLTDGGYDTQKKKKQTINIAHTITEAAF